MDIRVSKNNIHIDDSAAIEKLSFASILLTIRKEHPDCSVFKRTIPSLVYEWAAHNFLYNMHIARKHTKDVDLNYPQIFLEKVLYPVIGYIGWIFIE